MHTLRFLPLELVRSMEDNGTMMSLDSGQEIMREGQYIKAVPLVLKGAIKVVSHFEEKELLLYYIQTKESCIMSLTAILENSPSRIFAYTESLSEVLLIPAPLVKQYLNKYPAFQQLFFQQFSQRYNDLLNSIQQVLFQKIDQRVLNYLREKSELQNSLQLKISHKEIAADLGSAREVISRAIKKLEQEGKVKQERQGWIFLKW